MLVKVKMDERPTRFETCPLTLSEGAREASDEPQRFKNQGSTVDARTGTAPSPRTSDQWPVPHNAHAKPNTAPAYSCPLRAHWHCYLVRESIRKSPDAHAAASLPSAPIAWPCPHVLFTLKLRYALLLQISPTCLSSFTLSCYLRYQERKRTNRGGQRPSASLAIHYAGPSSFLHHRLTPYSGPMHRHGTGPLTRLTLSIRAPRSTGPVSCVHVVSPD